MHEVLGLIPNISKKVNKYKSFFKMKKELSGSGDRTKVQVGYHDEVVSALFNRLSWKGRGK
jgi:hypothetical protein